MKQDILQISMTYEIFFPHSPEDVKTKNDIFNKLLSLIKNLDKPQNTTFKSNKSKRRMFLGSDNFCIDIRWLKKFSTEISLVNPRENLDSVNQVTNEILNYINTVLGEKAKESSAIITKVTCKLGKSLNLSKQIIGEKRLAEINEILERTLNPVGVIFAYEREDIKYILGVYSGRRAETVHIYKEYKEPIPFNFIKDVYNKEFPEPEQLIKKLYQVQL